MPGIFSKLKGESLEHGDRIFATFRMRYTQYRARWMNLWNCIDRHSAPVLELAVKNPHDRAPDDRHEEASDTIEDS